MHELILVMSVEKWVF